MNKVITVLIRLIVTIRKQLKITYVLKYILYIKLYDTVKIYHETCPNTFNIYYSFSLYC